MAGNKKKKKIKKKDQKMRFDHERRRGTTGTGVTIGARLGLPGLEDIPSSSGPISPRTVRRSRRTIQGQQTGVWHRHLRRRSGVRIRRFQGQRRPWRRRRLQSERHLSAIATGAGREGNGRRCANRRTPTTPLSAVGNQATNPNTRPFTADRLLLFAKFRRRFMSPDEGTLRSR